MHQGALEKLHTHACAVSPHEHGRARAMPNKRHLRAEGYNLNPSLRVGGVPKLSRHGTARTYILRQFSPLRPLPSLLCGAFCDTGWPRPVRDTGRGVGSTLKSYRTF
jgi:hypothetical protein